MENSEQQNLMLQEWVGRTQTETDVVTAVPPTALAATLDIPVSDFTKQQILPPLWHWLYFLPTARQSEIGPDGHPRRGDFLPPVDLPRRMWAGSQIEFHKPIHIGDEIERKSVIESVTSKTGKSGQLVFVKVKHTISSTNTDKTVASDSPNITEFHDIVYRQAANSTKPDTSNARPKPADVIPAKAQWEHKIQADDVLLFRYSALTFNGHRIHYDRRYVTEVEGYPGLVVHGPLIATLLLNTACTELNNQKVASFEFKARSPLFDIHPFHVCGSTTNNGDTAELWAKDHSGNLAMHATARFDKGNLR